MRRDENTGLAEKPIQVARKNFRFLVQGESLDGSAVLRAARVIRAPQPEGISSTLASFRRWWISPPTNICWRLPGDWWRS